MSEEQLLVPQDTYLKSGIHIGTKHKTKYMAPFIYKTRPESYLTAAKWLQLDPSEIMMVACHNFDLNAARSCGFKTAFVRRPTEWGPQGPPDPTPHPDCDMVVDRFEALADTLGL